MELAAGSMMVHHRRMHSTESVIDWNQLPVSQIEHMPHVFLCQIPEGHLPVPINLLMLSRVILYLKLPQEPLQPEILGGYLDDTVGTPPSPNTSGAGARYHRGT